MLPGTLPEPIMDELMLLMGPGEEENPPRDCVETTEERWGFTELFIFMFKPHGKVLELSGDGTLAAQFW